MTTYCSITFASTRNGGEFQVFAMNADGSNVRQLTTERSNFKSGWSPDGAHIAFEAGAAWSTAGWGELHLTS